MNKIKKKIEAISDIYINETGEKGSTGFTVTYEDVTFKNFVKFFYKYKKEVVVSEMTNIHKKIYKGELK